MSIVSHGVMGSFLSFFVYMLFYPIFLINGVSLYEYMVIYPTNNVYLLFLWGFSFILGAMPDLSAFIDGIVRGKEYRWSGLYSMFHHIEKHPNLEKNKFWNILINIPHIKLHLYLDKHTHCTSDDPAEEDLILFRFFLVKKGQTTGWNKFGYIWELNFWLVITAMSILIFF